MARGSSAFDTGQGDLTSTPVLLIPARPGRITVVISPMSSVNTYYGKSTMTKTNGLFSPAGASVTLDTAAEIWGCSDSNTRVSWIDYY